MENAGLSASGIAGWADLCRLTSYRSGALMSNSQTTWPCAGVRWCDLRAFWGSAKKCAGRGFWWWISQTSRYLCRNSNFQLGSFLMMACWQSWGQTVSLFLILFVQVERMQVRLDPLALVALMSNCGGAWPWSRSLPGGAWEHVDKRVKMPCCVAREA